LIKVVFICHGNICRSPMAEFIFKSLVKEAGLLGEFEIDSAATSREEIGNDVYSPAKDVLKRHGIEFSRRSARQISLEDFEYYEYIVAMEEYNLANLRRMFPGKNMEKCRLLMSFAGKDADVSDPWYTRDFDKAYSDIHKGCEALLSYIEKNTGNVLSF